jgi:sporulation protein YabP
MKNILAKLLIFITCALIVLSSCGIGEEQYVPEGEFYIKTSPSRGDGGVREVVSFDSSNVTLTTDGGEMSIDGEGLRVGVLDIDTGRVSLSGKINAVYYFDNPSEPSSHGFFGKLFK